MSVVVYLDEIKEAPVGADFQINQSGDAGCETARGVIGWIEEPDETTTKGAKKIFADIGRRELGHGGVVKGAAHDRTPLAVSVGEERIPVAWVGRRTKPFANTPSIVGAGDAIVDLFEGAFSYIIDKEPARPRLKAEGEGVAQTDGPDGAIVAGRRTGDSREGRWIVQGNRAVGIDAQTVA